jgi:two-component system cell cycle sensor histidine kinase/response regulator CckA
MANKPISVLFIEDNPGDCRLVREMLAEAHWGRVKMECADRLSAGLERLAEGGLDCVLLDLTLLDSTGLDTFERVHAHAPEIAIVIISGLGDETLAIEAVRNGAQDYLVKDHLGSYVLGRSIRYAIERKRMEEDLERYREHLEDLVEQRTAEVLRTNKSLQAEIAERIQAEKDLKVSEVRYRCLFEAAQDGILILEAETGKIVDVNPFLVAMLGYSREEFIGKRLWDIGLLKDIAASREAFRQLRERKYIRYEHLPLKIKNERHRDVEFVSNVYRVDGREVIQCNVRDISERIRDVEKLKKAYARLGRQSALLAQQTKMSAIGVLGAGVAHELNNPLMAMLHFAQYCLNHIAEDDQTYTVLQDIEHEARRCIAIVKDLLTFSHSGAGKKEKYELKNPAEILERVVRLLSYRIEKEGVSLTSHVDEETPKIRMHENAMQDVILNLLTNALDALEESKKKEVHIDIRTNGDGVLVSVADSGSGIPPEVIGNIYDPFFTTKAVGGGTGLGLSLCQGVIHAHGGEITCESEPGKGTVFHAFIPTQRRKGAKSNEAHFSDRRR